MRLALAVPVALLAGVAQTFSFAPVRIGAFVDAHGRTQFLQDVGEIPD